jgi:sigma-B regulation protein RsbU (phosphoserine phosphatase)
MNTSPDRFELTTLIDSTKLILESKDQEFILNALLLMVMGKLLITQAVVLLKSEEDVSYTVAQGKGRTSLTPGDRVMIHSLYGDPLEIPWVDAEQHPDQFPEILLQKGYHAMIQLRTHDEHLGWLCVGKKPNGTSLSQSDREFLHIVVIMPAVAIANARLFDHLQLANRNLDRKVHELNTLFDLSQQYNQSVDRTFLLRTFKYTLLGQLGIRHYLLILKRNEQYEILSFNGFKVFPLQEDLEPLFMFSADGTIPISASVRELLGQHEITHQVALYLQDQHVAGLFIGNRNTGERFSSFELDFLTSLGNLVLMSVQRTYLIESRIEKERLESELEVARTIQMALLPTKLPHHDHFLLSCHTISSRQVGGDYYDVLDLGNGRFLVAIGDVTGKGVPASLIMANLQAMVHLLAPFELSLSEKTARINDMLYKNTPDDRFVTFFWGIYDTTNSLFTYVNAGHNPPLLVEPTSSRVHSLSDGGLLLGALPTLTPYLEGKHRLEEDTVIVFYTDGITEAMNDAQEEFGEDRLQSVILEHKHANAEAIKQALIHSVNEFTKGQYQDDVTLVILKKTKPA